MTTPRQTLTPKFNAEQLQRMSADLKTRIRSGEIELLPTPTSHREEKLSSKANGKAPAP